ncbi:MAG: aldehyde dehydrogenase (NADP(+)) [Acidobacteria bacterium]|nr:aldehyde dehydrogenase (NADP(+)) [Acidobacteriota bacterium]
MKLTGKSIIGFGRGVDSAITFTAFDPSTGEAVGPAFHSADIVELNRACELAGEARIAYGHVSGIEKARFLRVIADNIEALGDTLIERASLETGLPNARFVGERGRTCFQLRMFADLVERGDWVDARIDTPDPDRQPLPKPDVRSMLRPLGPVAVFCASNFPLAYSVAGGDTASALAAGCPVIVNAHFAHPGTAELVGTAVSAAVRECGLPEGVFSLIFSKGYEIGQALVKNPNVKAVGFTGSRAGGRALMDIAAARSEPIPVYTEMSSVNPIFILPSAMRERFEAMAAGLHTSVTTGAGQFCTKPGIVVIPEIAETIQFKGRFRELIENTAAHPLLTAGIRGNFERLSDEREIEKLSASHERCGYGVDASVFETDAATFLADKHLADEIFGPTTLLVESSEREEMLLIARELEGQLTATIHGTPDDLLEFADLIGILETKAGRLIFNGYPTGVEVGPAMVHGGPYPATSDSRTSAVGTRAIDRFCRYVCYQNFPNSSLADELKDENPLGIKRLVDGRLEFRLQAA